MLRIPSTRSRQLAILAALAGLLVLLYAPDLAFAAEGDEFEKYKSRGWAWAYLGAFGFGILTSLTPCVYPMIPIVIGIFGGRGKQVSRGRAVLLATVYVLGMGLMFSVLGVVFALIGKQSGQLLAEPAVVIPIVLLYIALAFSMFGAFEMQLPSFIQNKLSSVSGEGVGGAFAMGVVGGFTAAPCTGPFLIGILTFVTKTQNVAVGSSLLFTYAIGMGVLFWVLAAFAVALPKSGRWMEYMKSIGGIALLTAGLYFLRPLIPAMEQLVWGSWIFLGAAALVVIAGIALGAIHLSFHDVARVKLRKGAAVLLCVVGLGAAINWIVYVDRHLPWQRDEQTAFQMAKAEGKGVMVDFWASWCGPCKEMEKLTFAKSPVYETITENFVPLQFDMTTASDANTALLKKYRAGTPTVIFFTNDGKEISRVHEYQPPSKFLKTLGPAADKIRAQREAVAAGQLLWQREEAAAFKMAKAERKGVMIDFTAQWCAPCKELERTTYADPPVYAAITENFVPLQFDMTRPTDATDALMEKYSAGTPTVLFLSADGTELGRVREYQEPTKFMATIQPVVNTLRAQREATP